MDTKDFLIRIHEVLDSECNSLKEQLHDMMNMQTKSDDEEEMKLIGCRELTAYGIQTARIWKMIERIYQNEMPGEIRK